MTLSFHQKRGAEERGWGQVAQSKTSACTRIVEAEQLQDDGPSKSTTREEYPVNLFFERSQYDSTVPE